MDGNSICELVELLLRRRDSGAARAIFIVGAGVSAGAIDAADTFKSSLVREMVLKAGMDPEDEALKPLASNNYAHRKIPSYLTLELLMYFFEYVIDGIEKEQCTSRNAFDVQAIIEQRMPSFGYTEANHALAVLRHEGVIGPILTANFDTLLYDALEVIETPYMLRTNTSFVKGSETFVKDPSALTPTDDDIVAFHGTLAADRGAGRLDRPGTVVARGLMRPFETGLSEYLRVLFRDALDQQRPVVMLGYSGSDHYDMNVFLRDFMETQPDGHQLGNLIRLVRHSPGDTRAFSQFVYGYLLLNGAVIHESERAFAGTVLQSVGADRATLKERLETLRQTRYPQSCRDVTPWATLLAGVPTDAARKAVRMLARGFPGAWAITEHYTLESFGFDQTQIDALAGFQDPVQFLGLDISLFNKAQETYWSQRKIEQSLYREYTQNHANIGAQRAVRISLGSRQGGILPALLSCFQLCEQLDAAVAHNGPFAAECAPEELAMTAIFRAIATDYEGLLYQFLARSIEDRQLRKDLLALALDRFIDCQRHVQTAQTRLGKPGLATAEQSGAILRDMVPYALWQMVASENAARVMPGDDIPAKVERLRACVKHRRQLVEKTKFHTPFERVAMLPQMSLRLTEAIKLALLWEVRDPEERRALAADPRNAHLLAMAESLLAESEEVFETYGKQSSLKNYRFIAHFECKIAFSIISGSYDEPLGIWLACQSIYGNPGRDPRADAFVANMAKAIRNWIEQTPINIDSDRWRRFLQELPA